ncbi:hypothetical protein EIP86_010963 [Pleurotus ostreatoroseus]|nr:hypothetical protein EIP86_010963 [Pleurotus ostreatoroseus]
MAYLIKVQVGFLSNLVKVFPSLASRPFYLTGESYAGRYIPYIAQAIFSSSNPPVNLTKIMIGDPAFGSTAEFKTMPTLSLIETYPQLIDYDTDVYDYFKNQAHLCGLDLNVTYPQTGGNFPTINITFSAQNTNASNQDPDDDKSDDHKQKDSKDKSKRKNNSFVHEVRARHAERRASGLASQSPEKRHKRETWKRDLSGLPNNSVDPWYGCYVWDEIVDYAVNFTYPWSKFDEFDTFDVPDALNPDASFDPSSFLNGASCFLSGMVSVVDVRLDNDVRRAIHAPNQDWQQSISYPWGSDRTYVFNRTSPQNTTFGGTQGFTRKPGTSWWDDDGRWSGIVHQERNWTYALFYGASHEVPAAQPVAVSHLYMMFSAPVLTTAFSQAYTFVREFLLGNNQTGLVQSSNGSVTVVGGENPSLQQLVIPGQAGIAYGSMTTEGLTTWPTATVAAFESYVGIESITGTDNIQPTTTSSSTSGSSSGKTSAGLSSKHIDMTIVIISLLICHLFVL